MASKDVVNQLMVFGFQPHDINKAARLATNPNDINEIMDIIDKNANDPNINNIFNSELIPKDSFNINIDVKIFHLTQSQCNTSLYTVDCQCIQRIIQCANYFHSLDINNSQHQQKILRFLSETYGSLLDDYIHLTTKHRNQVDKIMQQYSLKKCDLFTCQSLQRHHSQEFVDIDLQSIDEEKQIELVPTPMTPHTPNTPYSSSFRDRAVDDKLCFYLEILDGVHCYLHHLYDVGLRVEEPVSQMIIYEDNDDINNPIDRRLSVMHSVIQKQNRRFSKMTFPRVPSFSKSSSASTSLSVTKMNLCNNRRSSKFTICSNDFTVYYKKLTRIDGLYQHLNDYEISNKIINKLNYVIRQHEYDSDSLQHDVEVNNQSNILIQTNNKKLCNLIKQFMRISQNESFSIGYIFYYWSYYKDTTFVDDYGDFVNKNDHSGYKPHELYVAAKYAHIKQEILSNKIYRLPAYEFNLCWKSVQHYYDESRTVRQVTADDMDFYLFYGIQAGSPLTFNHLIALYLYCNQTIISTKFSETFRKKFKFESIVSIKKRNKEYANWSRLLREAVQYYGKLAWVDAMKNIWNDENDRIKGPFFTGMNKSMILPEFNIRLCSPTSTSVTIEVATRFAGEEGTIIELNTNGYYHSEAIRTFNCSWISKYKEEDEFLFVGGDHRIKIVSVRQINMKECLNFGDWCEPLFYFDCMVSGTSMKKKRINPKKQCYQMLEGMINHEINAKKCIAPDYIQDTFKALVTHKKQIVINLHQINRYYKRFKCLLFENNIENILKISIIKLFNNCQKLIIYSTNGNGQMQYKFDIRFLLSIIKAVKMNRKDLNEFKIFVKATHKYNSKFERLDFSWIYSEWVKSKEWLIAEFGKDKYKIVWNSTVQQGNVNLNEDTLIVS